MDYPGTVIVVSHDRYFLNRIPTRILELDRTGMTEYLGAYDYYVEKKASIDSGKKYLSELSGAFGESGQKNSANQNSQAPASQSQLSSAEERALKKQKEAEERRLKREKERLEALIAELEERISANECEMCKEENLSNHKYLSELDEENSRIRTELDEAYEKWMELE